MKKNIQILLACAALFLINAQKANAQKLPGTQSVSLWAPDNIKVDGTPSEWGDKFQAYNKSTNIFYSIANDDKRLYLVVQTPDPALINKILGGGIFFAINKEAKRDLKESATITYPVLRKENRLFIQFSSEPSDGKIIPDVTSPFMRADSFYMVNNSRLAKKSKFILVTGIKDIDEQISIYNQDGIKAVSLFDSKMVYTYELAIDLKLLGFDNSQVVKFAYNIKLPGMFSAGLFGNENTGGVRIVSIEYTPSDRPVSVRGNPHGYNIMEPTDFWGEYTLAKKQ